MAIFGKDGTDPEYKRLADEIGTLTKEVAKLTGQRDALAEQTGLSDQVNLLKGEKTRLETELEKLKESHARESREIEHKLGLHRTQIDSERKIMKEEAKAERIRSVEEAKLSVREENLSAERKRFEDEIKFRTQRFEEEARTLRDLTGQILARLPNVTAAFTQHVGEPAQVEKKALKA